MSSPVEPLPAEHTPSTVAHAVCQGCGCLCDDISVEIAGGGVSRLHNVCELGGSWFEDQLQARVPATGGSVSSDAIQAAARLLLAARFPIILGIESFTAEAQRLVVELATLVGAVIATGSSSATVARQEVGEVTCTLGEIRSRADLVVFWFADPVRTHPRHLERYAGDCRGRFIPNGRSDRRLIVVDQAPTATSRGADEFIPLDAGGEFEALQKLRLAVRRNELGQGSVEHAKGGLWAVLGECMRRARYGVFVFDPARYGHPSGVEAIYQLVRDLNASTCFAASALGPGQNAKGAKTVLTWLTGFPVNVSISEGGLHYNGDECSANELLRRRRPDAAIVIGSRRPTALSEPAARHLSSIPSVHVGPTPQGTGLHLSAASPIETSGSVFRMDGVPLPSCAIAPATRQSPEEVLGRLLTQVRVIQAEIPRRS